MRIGSLQRMQAYARTVHPAEVTGGGPVGAEIHLLGPPLRWRVSARDRHLASALQ